MYKDCIDLQGAQILLVDDIPANLDVLCTLLETEGYQISLAPSGEVALKIAARAEKPPELILLDVMMPGLDGFEVCRRLKQHPDTRDIPVIFITAEDQTASVVTGFQVGGVDYIPKPFRDEEVLMRVQTHLCISRLLHQQAANNEKLARNNRELQDQIALRKVLSGRLSSITAREAQHWGLEHFVVHSPTMEHILEEVHTLQEQRSTSVLIAGESGTGKELVARAIHYGSPRKDGPFTTVNCADLPEDVVGSLAQRTQALSLLFGHVQGAFAGADTDQEGHFQMAHGGTLFLDEIGTIPLPLQEQLLRALQCGQVRRVGEKDGREVDVRVMASTKMDLQERVRTDAFSKGLYAYLTQFTVAVPPLRQRAEDIPLLARHFARLFMKEMGQEAPELGEEVIAVLRHYAWPGNVRELKNVIERALIESGGREIRPELLYFPPQTPSVERRVEAGTAA